MPDPTLANQLQWRPIPIFWDPIPDWIISQLDKAKINELAKVHLQYTQTVLQAQMDAVKQAQRVIAG
jgi:hypothetical protein